MKKVTFNTIIFSVLLSAAVAACSTEKPEEKEFIPEIEVEIEDENFRDFCLRHFDYNGDGVFTNYEAGIVVTLDISEQNIRSLKGIEHFVRLQNLDCSGNPLTELDLRFSPILRTLDCSGCEELAVMALDSCKVLHTINVSKCTALPGSMDLSKTPALFRLDCSYSAVNTFVATDSMVVYSLNMDGNAAPEGTRDFRWFSSLRELSLRSNGITALALDSLYNLERLYLSDNEIRGDLNLNPLASLRVLECNDVAISSLNIANCTRLDTLVCRNTRLRTLRPTTNTSLTYVDCSRDIYNSLLSSVDFSSNTRLAYLDCSNNQIELLDMERNTALKKLICANAGITGLGLATCVELDSLHCPDNLLDTLDLSKNRKLTAFDVRRNTHPNRPELTVYVWEGFEGGEYYLKDDDAVYEVVPDEEEPEEPVEE